MKKKIGAFGVIISVLVTGMSSVFAAENPKATEYRNMFMAKNYYVEYQDVGTKKALAVQGEKRMSFSTKYNSEFNPLSIIPIVGLFSMFSANDNMQPNVYYENGKFYQFVSKNEAKVATEKELNDPYIDPKEDWSSIRQRVSLPSEFNVFGVPDDFAKNDVFNYKDIKYESSGKAKIDKKEYDYDRYVLPTKSIKGNVLWENVYYVYYEKNELKKIKSSVKKNNVEKDLRMVNVVKITSEIPQDKVKIPEECKMYKAGLGDINDLLGKKVPLDK